MEKHVLGIDLSDAATSLFYYGSENSWRFPTILCRDRTMNLWYAGEDAYAQALKGAGVIIDKIWSLVLKRGMATANGTRYESAEILKIFLNTVIEKCRSEYKMPKPDQIVVSVPIIDSYICEVVTSSLTELGYTSDQFLVISRCESFIYYVMSQGREVWNNQVGLFYLSDMVLTYYEMRLSRNLRDMTVYAEKQDLDEAFNLEVLSTASGSKLADKIMASCAGRLLQRKLFSAVILTGKGFDSYEWAPNFMRYVCNHRKVFVEPDLFSKGAAVRGMDLAGEKPLFHFNCQCEGRLDAAVTLKIDREEKEMEFPIANLGDNWYKSVCSLRLLADGVNELEFYVYPVDPKKRKIVHVPLDFLPARPPKANRLDLMTSFTGARTMEIEIKDAGFGELFPKTDAYFKQEVVLWD